MDEQTQEQVGTIGALQTVELIDTLISAYQNGMKRSEHVTNDTDNSRTLFLNVVYCLLYNKVIYIVR